jgi:RNA polymerase sigma-70 factor, ECF subfamily
VVRRADERLAAIEVVYRERFAYFVRVAAAIAGDLETASQAVQEAFANVIQGRGGFRGEGPLEAWIWRAVVRSACRMGRDRLAARLRDEPVGVVPENGYGGEFAALRAAVSLLPERQRLAVFLRYYADLDYAQIAAVLGVKVGTVSASLSAALAALRAALDEEEVEA